MSRLLVPSLVALIALSAGCADEFDPYNEVQGVRVLAIAADRPALLEGESSVLSALVTEDVTYEWSWCPLSNGSTDGYGCAITHDDLQAIVDEALGEGTVVIPPYELGTEATATFEYSFPAAVLQGFCAAILDAGDLPDLGLLPSCEGQFEIKVRVAITSGEQQVIAVRDLDLRFDDSEAPNQNPQIGGVSIREAGVGDFVALEEGVAPVLERGVDYDLRLEVTPDASEPFTRISDTGEPQASQEDLVATWFYEAGDMDQARSSFLVEGTTTLDDLRENLYTAPTIDESEATESRLFFVLRDERGGLSFITRGVEFAP